MPGYSNSGLKKSYGENPTAAPPPLFIVPSRYISQVSHFSCLRLHILWLTARSLDQTTSASSNPSNANFTRVPRPHLEVAVASQQQPHRGEKTKRWSPKKTELEDLASLSFTSDSRNKAPEHHYRPRGSNSNLIPLPPPSEAAEVTTSRVLWRESSPY